VLVCALPSVAVCCSVLQWVAVMCQHRRVSVCVTVCVLQCVCCSVCVAVCVLQCVVMCRSNLSAPPGDVGVLQCAAVCCRVLQRVA